MSKILFSADWHIKLGQPKIPEKWQINRFHMLVDELNAIFVEHDCDLHIIGGDILDRFEPTSKELQLYFDLLSRLRHRTMLFTGNHELVSKTVSVLHHLEDETTRCNPLVTMFPTGYRSPEFDIIDYVELHRKWRPQESNILFSHFRAEYPHTTPEIELERLDIYDTVYAGDLHSYQCTQRTGQGTPIVYPGSPLSKDFHRNRLTDSNGVLVIEGTDYEWINLSHLPQPIRKTVTDPSEMVEDDYDRVIFEVVGNIEELKGVKDSDLLDKRVAKDVSKPATLDMRNTKVTEELSMYLEEVDGLPIDTVERLVGKFKDVIKDED